MTATQIEQPVSAQDWVLSLESVSKDYPHPPPMRLRRFFSRFGGLHVEDGFAADALAGHVEDDDELTEDDDDDGDDLRPQQLEIAGRRVIDDVSLRAYPGSMVALMGPAGAGKTVLLKLMGGIVAPSHGRVVVRGVVAAALNDMSLVLPSRGHRVRNALPQLGAMVGIPAHVVRSRFDDIAELVDAPQLLKSSTSLMESRRKRELVLAMALAVQPDVLLLDIPIADDDFGDRCMHRIDELRARGTLVVAEVGNPRRSRIVPDRVVLLADGRIVDPAAPDPVAVAPNPG